MFILHNSSRDVQASTHAADKALVGSMHANDARFAASSTYHDDYDAGRAKQCCGDTLRAPEYGVQPKRSVPAGRTCGGSAGLGAAASHSEYLDKYRQHSMQVRKFLKHMKISPETRCAPMA